ncbi:hypothetical protein [Streptomyces sp. PpalLS-921]|uniref:hypothetical protein n=1 Tax=Streptomyces sp. PpalLS-921 TaxID=1839772 RepID=UPI00081DC8B5|nr:hypothetical protein [Streptomyces sp. PpalLS-921]SCD99106.1 hypothetical protein GA0115249_111832 [Streptomyces sp. PpalLS-921]
MARANEEAPERGALEYVTYTPAGHACATCLRPLKSMEAARRIVLDRTSGPPLATYRHANDCPKSVAG